MPNPAQVTEEFRIVWNTPSGARFFYAGCPVWVPCPSTNIIVFATHAEAHVRLVSLAYGGWVSLQVVRTRRTVTEEDTVVSELVEGVVLSGKALTG